MRGVDEADPRGWAERICGCADVQPSRNDERGRDDDQEQPASERQAAENVQPFTPPSWIPSMKWRWARKNKIRIGKAINVDMAIM